MPKEIWKCVDCKAEFEAQVCKSAAGYYVGTICPNCGPYDRYSDYFATEKEAQSFLEENQ